MEKITGGIKNLSEQKEDRYKPVRVENFCSDNYIEYESNGDENEILSIKEHLDEIKPYWKDKKSQKS